MYQRRSTSAPCGVRIVGLAAVNSTDRAARLRDHSASSVALEPLLEKAAARWSQWFANVAEDWDRHNRNVAGFDFGFTYRSHHEPVVRACLSSGRARARQLRIRWRWQHLGPTTLRVIVDGNSRRTDLLCYRLERDLPLVAEGCEVPGLSRAARQRLGRGFADMLVRGRHVDQERAMVLRGVARTRWRFPPYDYDCRAFPSLSGRLIITEDVIVAWNFNEIAPEVFLEELHTACELVLEELVNRRSKRRSFAELVATAETGGALRDADSGLSGAVLLTQLKDLRKDVRHRGASGAAEWLDLHWEDVATLLERLVDRLNRTLPPDAGVSLS